MTDSALREIAQGAEPAWCRGDLVIELQRAAREVLRLREALTGAESRLRTVSEMARWRGLAEIEAAADQGIEAVLRALKPSRTGEGLP